MKKMTEKIAREIAEKAPEIQGPYSVEEVTAHFAIVDEPGIGKWYVTHHGATMMTAEDTRP